MRRTFDTYYDSENAVSGHPEFGKAKVKTPELRALEAQWAREDLVALEDDDDLAEAA